ncbi:MAG: methyltransferase [Chitinophagales bacterium]|nr:methyltransferase [Hyphomicrobiales bacterium]
MGQPAVTSAATKNTGSAWLDRLFAARDRLIGSARFQRWAAAFPLTRGVARKHERALFDLCAGFVYSQTLLACVRLKLFDLLRDNPLTPSELAVQLSLPLDSTIRLLKAAAALGLLSRRGGDRYGLGMLGAALAGDPGIAAMVEHHSMLYADLHDPVALLRGDKRDTRLAQYWPYADGETGALRVEDITAYTALMSASQPQVAAEVLDAYSMTRHKHLMDVGGGDGAFLSAAAARAPHLRLSLLDLPPVAAKATARFLGEGLAGRAKAMGGDFLRDPLPEGADVITLVRIILDHGDDAALAILQGVRRALAPGGVLLLAEPMSRNGADAVTDAYFGLYLFAMGRGRARTFEELSALLRHAGFTRMRPLPSRRPLLTSIIQASA